MALVATLPVAGGTGGPAAAAVTTVALDCEADAPLVGATEADQDIDLDVSAPATAEPGAEFDVVATTGSFTIPETQGSPVGDVDIVHARDIRVRFPVPANATFVDVDLAGGSGLGPGTPTAALDDDDVLLTIPGPIAGGATLVAPDVTVTLEASGAEGSTVDMALGGTSFADPGFELTINADVPVVGNSDIPTDCFPKSPNPVLSSTTIVGPDVTAPAIDVVVPVDGGSYALGAAVLANYSCDDGPFGSGVASCTGDVPSGAPLDTGALGTFTFTVESDDLEGNGPVTEVVSYDVVPASGDQSPPTVTLTTPPNGVVYDVGSAVTADFDCADETALASCVGTTADGVGIDTTTPGVKTFTVDALDDAGNPTTVRHFYRVRPLPVQHDFSGGSHGANRIPVDCDTLFGAFDESIPVDDPPANTWHDEVPAGGTFTWAMRISQDVIPPFNDGSDVLYRFRAPTNGSFVSASLTDAGEHVNGATIEIVGGKLELRVDSIDDDPGLISNDPWRPPAFEATIAATGPVGSQVTTDMEYFELRTTLGGVSHCPTPDPPDPNPTLVAADIVDATAPTVSLTAPAHGAVYSPGASVLAAYGCGDETGLASCVGSVADGSPLDTSTSGIHQFSVLATDTNGNRRERIHTYTIGNPEISVADATATEGDALVFDVTLSNPSDKTVTVGYTTADGSAEQPDDYTLRTGTVTFDPGDTVETVEVPTAADSADEADEDLTLTLGGPTNAYLGSFDVGVGTIADGPITFFTRIADEHHALYLAAADHFGVAPEDLPTWSMTVVAYLLGPDPVPGGGAAVLPPGSNDGPHVYASSYPDAVVSEVLEVADHFGLDGDDVHYLATTFVMFAYVVQTS